MANPKPKPSIDVDDLPSRATVDWDLMSEEAIVATPDDLADEPAAEPNNQLAADTMPEEDDDNPYQNSDEALPSDGEENVISRKNLRHTRDPA
jgi:hypothetical protein